jgi:ribonuclease HI
MLVTINTDASFHQELKYGSYAFWAVCNEFKILKSGVFKTKCLSPDDAEARCIINALKVVLSANSNITKIIVNTDSLNAIALLKNDKKIILKYVRHKYHQFKHIRVAYSDIPFDKNRIEYRHVKAHAKASDARSYVNDWCDKEAKKQLRQCLKNETVQI